MMLADMGADVLRVDHPESGGRPQSPNPRLELVNRGRRSAIVDLKHPDGRDLILELVSGVDALFEGFRPGVVERLGVGPDECLSRNPSIVYARATGWGQTGPLADVAGHDINYIALAGALEPIGLSDHPPIPPLNLVGDYGGGGAMLAFGIVCGLLEVQRSKQGQIIDAAMMDGASLLMTMIHGRREMGVWKETRGTNYLDGGAPFYSAYETLDGKYISIGSIEDEFYATFVAALGLDISDLPPQWDRSSWPATKARIAEIIRTKTRREWEERMGSRDVCFAPVLALGELADHPHHQERGSFVDIDGIKQPAPMPRFSRTVPEVSRPPAMPGEHTCEALLDWGIEPERVDRLIAAGAVIEG
jgi:alpha-methylacyl-CoA racemase